MGSLDHLIRAGLLVSADYWRERLPTNILKYVYMCPPVDILWEYVQTVQQVADSIRKETNCFGPGNILGGDFGLYEFLSDWDSALHFARAAGWEGDITEGPGVFFLPKSDGDNIFDIGYIFKQSNNGTTFVISPFELPHLSEYLVDLER